MKPFKLVVGLFIFISLILLGHTFYVSAQNAKKIDEIRYAIEREDHKTSQATIIDQIKDILRD
jgi:hypothetical protein